MKTLQEIRSDIEHAMTEPQDTDRMLDICLEIVLNLQRIDRHLKETRRVADDASWGPRKIGCE